MCPLGLGLGFGFGFGFRFGFRFRFRFGFGFGFGFRSASGSGSELRSIRARLGSVLHLKQASRLVAFDVKLMVWKWRLVLGSGLVR